MLLVVVPALDPDAGDPGASPGSAVPSPSRSAVEAGVVPNTVGLATADAIALAEQAGLAWTVRCNEDQSRPEGIVDQEPPPGTQLSPGAPFTMFSARIEDCR